MFTKAELDARAPNHPVFVRAVGFTGVQVNTAGLTRLGLTAGMRGVVLGPDGQEQADCLEDFMHEMNRRGLTGWDDPGGNDPFDPNGSGITVLRDQHGYQAVNLLYRQGRMTTRITFNLSCFGPDAVIGVECVKRRNTRWSTCGRRSTRPRHRWTTSAGSCSIQAKDPRIRARRSSTSWAASARASSRPTRGPRGRQLAPALQAHL
jgi:predicted amidohydrolase YtcJ